MKAADNRSAEWRIGMTEFVVQPSDLEQHIVTFGVDVYPQIDIANDRTRLNMFYEEGKEKWPEVFDQISASDLEFKLSKAFRQRHEAGGGPELRVVTFELVPRGPLFRFPLQLSQIGKTRLHDDFRSRFSALRTAFFKHLPGRAIMKVGLVRDLIFSTSGQRCEPLLHADNEFGNAKLQGGACNFHYRDAKCNVLLHFQPVQAITVTQLPVGHTVTTPGGFGLHVALDVNSAEIRALQDADIDEVLDRASGLWPDELLNYLNARMAL